MVTKDYFNLTVLIELLRIVIIVFNIAYRKLKKKSKLVADFNQFD